MDADDVSQMVTIAVYPSEQVANEKARTLVEHGVGAVVGPGVAVDVAELPPLADPVAERNTDEYAAVFELKVIRLQVPTACEVLDLELPAEVVADELEAAKESPPWKRILLIWAVAMVVLPLAAGYVTYFIFSR